ncbi:MAG: type-F conjugative transfer system secretin TraK [bacterium]
MITKLKISLFLLLFSACSIFAEEASRVATPHGTTQHNSDQQGTSGVDAGATDKSVASANIVATKNTENENNEQKIKSKPAVVNYAGVREIPFADNEQIKVVLSNRDINRVLVTGDKIKTIHGPTGLYTAKNDNSDPFGAAYISAYADTSFTIFLATVKGHNLSLLITPKTLPGRTVILEPTTPSLFAGAAETDGYQKMLIDLISNMINAELSEDYAYLSASEAKRNKKTNFYNVAYVKPIAFYRGENLLGSVSEIKNRTRNPLTLKPSYFYQSGVKAVALSHQTIPPLGTCLLYRVIDHK